MTSEIKYPNKKQQIFQEMVLGTLLYAAILGFFNDYTDILVTSSYSTTFLLAIVMQLLTFATFLVKDKIVLKLGQHNSKKIWLVFSIWLVMFVSKFIFLAVIEFVFSQDVQISGFIGLLLIIISLTIAQNLVQLIYKKLAN